MTTHCKLYDTAAMSGDVNLISDRPGMTYDGAIVPPVSVEAVTHGKLDIVTAEGDPVSLASAIAPHPYFGSEVRTLKKVTGGCVVLVRWDVPAPFYATDVADCICSLDASIVTQDSNGVSSWDDQSGTANASPTQATNSLKPVQMLAQADFAGRAVLDFDADHLAWSSYSTPATAAHMFIVLAVDAKPAATANESGAWDMGTSSQSDNSPTTTAPGNVYCGILTSNRYACGDPSEDITKAHILEIRSSNNSQEWEMLINGVQQHLVTSTTTFGWNASGRLGESDGGTLKLAARVAALHMFSGDLTGGEVDFLRKGLATRFGITLP